MALEPGKDLVLSCQDRLTLTCLSVAQPGIDAGNIPILFKGAFVARPRLSTSPLILGTRQRNGQAERSRKVLNRIQRDLVSFLAHDFQVVGGNAEQKDSGDNALGDEEHSLNAIVAETRVLIVLVFENESRDTILLYLQYHPCEHV